ncbi:HXXXD-type acyl-transferase family protein [Abeliophyllum distichum]|uniref:HXXXD-type acyl-transferase family protein n=1 Tax=Abeliophyllum distichum TaxID=126358 RepID=A0ABD1RFL2_9LAMI
MKSTKSLVNVMSRKMIKPCTPTPHNLRNQKLSFIDEVIPTLNSASILYYPFNQNIRCVNNLEKSLAQILPHFYPFAGRYSKEDNLIDCSDQGAEFVEAQVDCKLVDIIGLEELNDFLPVEVGAADEVTDPIMSIQINKFKCGGIAIATSISHRIADAASLNIFLSAWAKASRGDQTEPIIPNFDSPLYFPGQNLGTPDYGITRTRNTTLVTKRILFDSKAISTLRDRVSHLYENSHRPASRVLLVTSFLTGALLRSDRAKLGKPRGCLLTQVVNIRERTVPNLSKYSCGNLITSATVECSADETKSMDFEHYVTLLGNTVKKTVSDCAKILGKDGHKILFENLGRVAAKAGDSSINTIQFTDLSKFGFYEVDFGFGKPNWTSIANIPIKNLIILLNTKENDGIEAWIHLHEEDMHYIEQDKEIRKLTT